MTNKNRFEMDQTLVMNVLREKNQMNTESIKEINSEGIIDEKIKWNEKHMANEEHSVYEMVRIDDAAGVNVIYGYTESIKESGMHSGYTGSDVIELAPITVSRKVTHRRGRKTNKRAGRFSMLLGACAMTLGLTVAAPSAGAQKLEQGIRSEHVVQLQEQLNELGYFDAGVTGYYGTITKSAVREFQQAQGLSADGVAGPVTLNRLNQKVKAEGETLRQLAKLIHGEARGESFEGQVAVGAVVLNRVQSGEFPSSISEVIFQKGQFTAVDDGQFNLKPTATSFKAARQALNGVDPTHGALFYYNPKIATSEWSKSRPTLLTIGQHDFTR
ncbi:cell wall hydrolase [Paenibacillus xylanexedens]|uniref:cell wall hydrolase n=1 Tax=Paenibacillus xylanexedens TaxID=528191 RepID=UPI0021B6990A|nr:cell wall hydrolase [Paenibacillus xylanexedens]